MSEDWNNKSDINVRPRFSRPSEPTNWERSDIPRCTPRVYPTNYADKIVLFRGLATKPCLQELDQDEYNLFSLDIF